MPRHTRKHAIAVAIVASLAISNLKGTDAYAEGGVVDLFAGLYRSVACLIDGTTQTVGYILSVPGKLIHFVIHSPGELPETIAGAPTYLAEGAGEVLESVVKAHFVVMEGVGDFIGNTLAVPGQAVRTARSAAQTAPQVPGKVIAPNDPAI